MFFFLSFFSIRTITVNLEYDRNYISVIIRFKLVIEIINRNREIKYQNIKSNLSVAIAAFYRLYIYSTGNNGPAARRCHVKTTADARTVNI